MSAPSSLPRDPRITVFHRPFHPSAPRGSPRPVPSGGPPFPQKQGTATEAQKLRDFAVQVFEVSPRIVAAAAARPTKPLLSSPLLAQELVPRNSRSLLKERYASLAKLMTPRDLAEQGKILHNLEALRALYPAYKVSHSTATHKPTNSSDTFSFGTVIRTGPRLVLAASLAAG